MIIFTFIIILSSASPEDNIIFLVDINGGGILYRMDLYTGSYVRIPINRLYTPTAIDYNPVEGRIYFVDPKLKQIASMHFSGDDIRELKQLDTSKELIHLYIGDLSRHWLSCLGPLVVIAPKTLNCLAFHSFDFERTW